jgi:hypothetical protein
MLYISNLYIDYLLLLQATVIMIIACRVQIIVKLNVVSVLFQALYPVPHLIQAETNQVAILDLHLQLILVMKRSVLLLLICQYDLSLMILQQVI